MKTSMCHLKRVLFKPLAIILAAIITPIIFTLVILILPTAWFMLWVYKQFVKCVAKFKIPDAKILSTTDLAMSLGVEYKTNHYYVTVQSVLEGYLSQDTVKKEVKITANKMSSKGHLEYSELKDYLQNLGGYLFRRKIQNFESDNYVHSYHEGASDGEMVDKLKLLEIRKKFHNKIFGKGCPLWEMLVVNNYRHNHSMNDPECTVVIAKFSHTLCDGFGCLKMVFENFAKFPVDLPKLDKRTVKYQFMKHFLLFKLPAFLFTFSLDSVFDLIYKPSRFTNSHGWHEPKQPFPEKKELCWTEPMSKVIFREIKSSCNVSVLSIVTNVVTGGMKRMMLAQNLDAPKYMRVLIPVPKLNRPGTLGNHLSIIVIRIPLWIDDCKKRLQTTDKSIKDATYGVQRFALNYLLRFFGEVPIGLKNIFGYDTGLSAIISCVPTPSSEVHLFNRKPVSLSYYMSSNRSKCACIFAFSGMGDNFHVSFEMNSTLLHQADEVNELEKYMLEELDYIGKMCLA